MIIVGQKANTRLVSRLVFAQMSLARVLDDMARAQKAGRHQAILLAEESLSCVAASVKQAICLSTVLKERQQDDNRLPVSHLDVGPSDTKLNPGC